MHLHFVSFYQVDLLLSLFAGIFLQVAKIDEILLSCLYILLAFWFYKCLVCGYILASFTIFPTMYSHNLPQFLFMFLSSMESLIFAFLGLLGYNRNSGSNFNIEEGGHRFNPLQDILISFQECLSTAISIKAAVRIYFSSLGTTMG